MLRQKKSQNLKPIYRKELRVWNDADESDSVSVAVEGRGRDAVDLTEAAKEKGQTDRSNLQRLKKTEII